MIRLSLLLALATFLVPSSHAAINGYITPTDRRRLTESLTRGFVKLQEGDVVTVYQAAKGFELLGEKVVTVLVRDSCAHLKKYFKDDASPEAAFHALSTWAMLKCEGKLHSDAVIKTLKSALDSDKSTTSDLRYAAEILQLLSTPIPNPEKVAKLLQLKLKEDDGLQSLGHALHAASLLGPSGKFILDRIEDVVVQADEVDGKMLQWEGGLTVTGLLLTGLFRVPGAKPLSEIQADKFGRYLLSRRSVQTPRGALALIQSAQVLAKSSVSPVSITIVGSPHVTSDKPDLTVKVTNVLGEALKSLPSPVVAQSATRITDDVVVLSKQPLVPNREPGEFSLSLRLDPGQYRLALSAGQHASTFTVRVLGPITLKNLEVGLGDADGTSAPKLHKLAYDSQLEQVLQADATHNLILKFGLPRPVHQAFLRLYSDKREIIFIAERDTSQSYKMAVNLAAELSQSGEFAMELIVGDAIVSNPIRWRLGRLDLSVPNSDAISEKSGSRAGPKPEIRHLFRQPEKRPPRTVSLLFTGLAASPLLLLFVLWAKVGVNVGNFGFAAVPFHVGLAAILGLFALFWLRLDMFVTCGWLLPIGGFTFLSGNVLLNKIARQRK